MDEIVIKIFIIVICILVSGKTNKRDKYYHHDNNFNDDSHINTSDYFDSIDCGCDSSSDCDGGCD